MTTEWLVPVDGAELSAEAFGDPSHPTLVLISGAAASRDWWDTELCERLADERRYVVRYDHRDTGGSTTGRPGTPTYGAADLDRDCVALVEGLASGPVHLVGVSAGGGIAQTVALRRPDLVASLTLVATSPVGDTEGELPEPTPEVAASFASPPPDPDWSDPASYADWLVQVETTYAGEIPVDEARLRDLAATVFARSHDPAAASNHWLVVGDAGDALDISAIAVPTLVVHGSADPLFPLPHGEAIAATIPGARLLVLPGMGHQVPPPETWDVVLPAILDHTRS